MEKIEKMAIKVGVLITIIGFLLVLGLGLSGIIPRSFILFYVFSTGGTALMIYSLFGSTYF